VKISEGIEHFYNYQRLNVKKNTLRNYQFILDKFQKHFGDIKLALITSENILRFMSEVSDGTKQSTKKLRFTLLAAFFNFINDAIDPDFQNPCDNPTLKKLFKAGKPAPFKILEKDVIDEIIFRTRSPRNRLMLELMARSCMRVGEVLKLQPRDIEERKVTIRDPKSGKESEVAFLPQKVADRLKNYINDNGIKPGDKIFPITYAAAKIVVKKAGELVRIHPWPRPVIPIFVVIELIVQSFINNG